MQDAECGYVAIDLEALAVAWAMEKFHHFLYASHFTLETDQKPLETILAMSLTEAPQLQQLLIHTFPYDFTVRYIKGSTDQLADCLSSLGCQKDKIELPKLKIHAITKQLHATSDRISSILKLPKMKKWHYLNTLYKLDGPTKYMTSQRKSNFTRHSENK